jgi:hypothetical protein
MNQIALLSLALLAGCGSASAQPSDPQVAQAEAPPPPPGPPAAPPPGETAPSLPTDPAAIDSAAPPPTTSPQPIAPPQAGAMQAGAAEGALPPLPSSAPQYAPAAAPLPGSVSAAPQEQETAPAQAQWVQSYPTGQWVFTSTYGWIWVPNGAATSAVEGVPYTYLYTPAYGWTWYVSPWGWGPYHYGGWVRHPWVVPGRRVGWVARPGVVVHLGGGRAVYRGGYRGRHRR